MEFYLYLIVIFVIDFFGYFNCNIVVVVLSIVKFGDKYVVVVDIIQLCGC